MGKRTLTTLAVVIVTGVAMLVGYAYFERLEEVRMEGDALFDKGVVYYHEKRFEESVATLEQVPDAYEHDWRLPYYKASALTQLRRFADAARFLEEARLLNGEEPKILYALGVVYYKLGQLEMSKAHFAAVVELDPANEHAKGMVDVLSRLERDQPQELPES